MSSSDEADAPLAAPPGSAASSESATRPELLVKAEPVARPEPSPAGGSDFRARARQAKLRMALSTLKAGKVNTAASQLLDIYREYAGTAEGKEAGAALGTLAEEHEAAGRFHMAAELYAKLTED